MNKTGIIAITLVNLFMIYNNYVQLQHRKKIKIRVRHEKLTTWIISIFFILSLVFILFNLEYIYIIVTLILCTYSVLLSPFVVGIGDEYIYYSDNRNFGTFPIRKIKIKNLRLVKLTIRKDKNYVKLEVLRTTIYQIYKLEDFDKLIKALDGNEIKIIDKSLSL